MVTQGKGEAKGMELMIEKTTGKLNGWASYTLMYNTRQFTQINQGRVFPSRYDRRHNFNLVGIYQFSKKFTLSGTWTFNTGFAYTLPQGIYPSPTATDPYAEIYIYGERNNARARANHRLDLSAQYVVRNKNTFKLGHSASTTVTIAKIHFSSQWLTTLKETEVYTS